MIRAEQEVWRQRFTPRGFKPLLEQDTQSRALDCKMITLSSTGCHGSERGDDCRTSQQVQQLLFISAHSGIVDHHLHRGNCAHQKPPRAAPIERGKAIFRVSKDLSTHSPAGQGTLPSLRPQGAEVGIEAPVSHAEWWVRACNDLHSHLWLQGRNAVSAGSGRRGLCATAPITAALGDAACTPPCFCC